MAQEGHATEDDFIRTSEATQAVALLVRPFYVDLMELAATLHLKEIDIRLQLISMQLL